MKDWYKVSVAKYNPDIGNHWIKIKNGTNLGPNQLEHGFYVSIKKYIYLMKIVKYKDKEGKTNDKLISWLQYLKQDFFRQKPLPLS